MSLVKAIKQGVYFCSDSGNFSYAAFCLADGLNQLGVPVFSNISDSHHSTSFQFTAQVDADLLKNSFCAIKCAEDTCDLFPNVAKYIAPIHERTVALCMHDNIADFYLTGEIPLFCTHENRFRRIDGFRIPMGFGVSQRMIEHFLSVPPFESRRKAGCTE